MSTKSPTIKRILKEATELSTIPSPDYHAAPLETNLFEWHFTLRGPPAPSPFANGIYHGRIILPPSYPLRPPSFRFLTPSGRFEPNREICLSISGFHEESWQPAWGIRTAIVAIRSFMTEDAKGQVGGMMSSDEVRRRLAGESRGWTCGGCGIRCEDVMRSQEEACREGGSEGMERKEESVPEGLRLGYRDQLGKEDKDQDQSGSGMSGRKEEQGDVTSLESTAVPAQQQQHAHRVSALPPGQHPLPTTTTIPTTAVQPQPPLQLPQQQQQQQRAPLQNASAVPDWIDKAIIGVIGALLYMVWRRFLS